MLSIHRLTSNSSSITVAISYWELTCLLVHMLLPLLPFVTHNSLMNYVTYIATEQPWTYSKNISCDRYPDSLLARWLDLQKTQLPLLLRVELCLQSCCLATLWSNTLQYISSIMYQWVSWLYCSRKKIITIMTLLTTWLSFVKPIREKWYHLTS
jgi:hypothetical protein